MRSPSPAKITEWSPITVPPLRERKEDIPLLFRKFASDFAQKYRMPPLVLDDSAQLALSQYNWSGNIRQLRNIAEQISVLESERKLTSKKFQKGKSLFLEKLPKETIL